MVLHLALEGGVAAPYAFIRKAGFSQPPAPQDLLVSALGWIRCRSNSSIAPEGLLPFRTTSAAETPPAGPDAQRALMPATSSRIRAGGNSGTFAAAGAGAAGVVASKLQPARTRAVRMRGRVRMDRDCAVVVMGEFGRTPKISPQVGRDHWPQVNCALMFGGDMRHGQVIGATDRIGGEAIARPVTFGEIYATLYRHLGIDSTATTLIDHTGRPQFLVQDNAPALREMV